MRIPADPPVGHLVAYEYLWSSKAGRRQDGAKTYPAALIMARRDAFGACLVYTLGISHMRPRGDRRALELPAKLRRHMGLDDDPQWIYTDEVNIFVWPGPDLRPAHWISRKAIVPPTCVLGPLPRDWFDAVKRHLAESHALKHLQVTKRTS